MQWKFGSVGETYIKTYTLDTLKSTLESQKMQKIDYTYKDLKYTTIETPKQEIEAYNKET